MVAEYLHLSTVLNYARGYTACATAASGGPLASNLLYLVKVLYIVTPPHLTYFSSLLFIKFLHINTSLAILEQAMAELATLEQAMAEFMLGFLYTKDEQKARLTYYPVLSFCKRLHRLRP